MTKTYIDSFDRRDEGGTLAMSRIALRYWDALAPEVLEALADKTVHGVIRTKEHIALQTSRGNVEDFKWFLQFIPPNARLIQWEEEGVAILEFWSDDEHETSWLEFNLATYSTIVRVTAAALVTQAVERRRAKEPD